MSKQTKANFKPVELTPFELDSVAGGNPVAVGLAALVSLAALSALERARVRDSVQAQGRAANQAAIKSVVESALSGS